jgi:hypothetical protein
VTVNGFQRSDTRLLVSLDFELRQMLEKVSGRSPDDFNVLAGALERHAREMAEVASIMRGSPRERCQYITQKDAASDRARTNKGVMRAFDMTIRAMHNDTIRVPLNMERSK